MVYGTTTVSILTDTPAFEQGGEIRVVDHFGKTLFMARISQNRLAHLVHRLEHIFLHIRTCMLLLGKDIQNEIISILISNIGENCQSMHPIICLAAIGGISYAVSCLKKKNESLSKSFQHMPHSHHPVYITI